MQACTRVSGLAVFSGAELQDWDFGWGRGVRHFVSLLEGLDGFNFGCSATSPVPKAGSREPELPAEIQTQNPKTPNPEP